MARWFLLPALLCGFVLAPVSPADDDKPAAKEKADDKKKADAPLVAHVRLTGDLDETPVSSEGLFGAPGADPKSEEPTETPADGAEADAAVSGVAVGE